MNQKYPKSVRVRSKREYRFIMRNAESKAGKLIVVCYCPTRFPRIRLGMTVSRKYGKAHERNRFKRMVREAFRKTQHLLPAGIDLNIKPRQRSKGAKSQDIMQELLALLVTP